MCIYGEISKNFAVMFSEIPILTVEECQTLDRKVMGSVLTRSAVCP